MTILQVNDHSLSVPLSVCTISDLVLYLKHSPEHVVVECNTAVYKGTDTTYTLQENDTINIVHFVGGGQWVAILNFTIGKGRFLCSFLTIGYTAWYDDNKMDR